VTVRIFESLDFSEKFKDPVLTIGNYDGVHLGHRTIIEIVKQKAREISGTSMLMTFHPHPLHILRPEKEPLMITPLPEKKKLIAATGIDVLIVVPFTEEFSQTSPEVFVRDILVGKLGIRDLVVGYDFKFGRGGRGDLDGMKKYALACGFSLDVVDAVNMDGEKVGSNKIRKVIQGGDVDKASHFLGRPYMLSGRVVGGQGRGRTFGFPTVNLETSSNLIPANGVYISELEFDEGRFVSVTNVGYSPTFGQQDRTIETFILDYSGDLYDRSVRLFFHKKIRDEIRFNDVEELRKRIEIDVECAREYFEKR
jgi:riboflavin kinase / FMN adenylyltransferase